ncbi:MAG: dockerin type I repeat-containing protein [Oscillospiraceae bacterium]|nr:dockerin type I repeat-containing protein [Oscillospiraceae bacterium]
MKKFISALSSLVITATALGGTFAFSTDAASTSTIIALQSAGATTVNAKAGDVIPVTMYVPQSGGFNTLGAKLTINGDETLGKGSVTKPDGTVIENYKYAFGNYGIKVVEGSTVWGKDNKTGFCLDSGWVTGNKKHAGYYNTGAMSLFTESAMNMSFIAQKALGKECDIDSYGAWVAAGSPTDYSSYTPVTTWSKTEEWAYEYSFLSFDLALPADLPDGTYVLDVYKDEYYVCTPSALFDESGAELPDDGPAGTVHKTLNQSKANGVNGESKLESEALTIVVGNATPGTTTTKAQTTTTKPQATTTTTKGGAVVDTAGKIIYNLVPDGKEYTAAADGSSDNNVYKATAGEDLRVNWTVKQDQGTAGLQIFFDFSQVEYVGSADDGDAYMCSPEINEKNANATTGTNAGLVSYVFGQATEEDIPDDGAVIYCFDIKVPKEDGTYTIGLMNGQGMKTKVVPKNQDQPHEVIFHGLDIVVGNATPGTTTTKAQTTTTTTKGGAVVDTAGKIIYNLVPDGKEYTAAADGSSDNNVYKATAGEDLRVNWTVKQDQGTAGLQIFFDFSQVEYVGSADDGDAYMCSPEINEKNANATTGTNAGLVSYVFGQATEEDIPDDGAVIYCFDIKVPKEDGTYTIGLMNGQGMKTKVVPKNQDQPHEVIFHGLDIVVGGAATTTTPKATTTTTAATTTTKTTTTTAATTTTTAVTTTAVTTTAPVAGTILWGDVNCDTQVRINDVVLLNKYLAGNATPTDQGLLNADCVYDSKLDSKDAAAIKKFLAWLIPHSDLGDPARKSTLGFWNECGW